jgi:hypothetical protein
VGVADTIDTTTSENAGETTVGVGVADTIDITTSENAGEVKTVDIHTIP